MGTRLSVLAVLCTLLCGLQAAGAAEAQEELFVSNANVPSVTVYSRTAGGNVVPLRTLTGALTGLNAPSGLAVDLKNNELFVANSLVSSPSVTVYSRTAVGNTAPLRTIVGPARGLNGPIAIALDLKSNELFVANSDNNSVTVYSRTASGNATPLRTLSGAATGLSTPAALALDLVNNELVVANFGDSLGGSVTVYNRAASGNTAPLRTLSGAATGLNAPRGVAVDLTNNELVVLPQGSESLNVYSRTASGNTAPLRTLSGAATQLVASSALALDLMNNELVVANQGTDAVTVYSRTANGNTGPRRILEGASTGVSLPGGLAVTASSRALDRDFNGDGKNDILWRHTNGTVAIWLMNGTSLISSAVLGTVTNDWDIAAFGDFNGDGKMDLLWRNTSGALSMWLMNGTSLIGSTILGTITTDWTIDSVGDVNGDGYADILWRHTSGAVSIWFMNGSSLIGTGAPAGVGPEWQIQ